MSVLILDPFHGIAGDMLLGALVSLGLEREWLIELPAELGLDDAKVRICDTERQGISCVKVDFDAPPQPHGRYLAEILEIVEKSSAPPNVRRDAAMAFTALAGSEARIHGVPVERVHLHEVGAVDAILDIVGGIWGIAQLGVSAVYNTAVAVGDGYVVAAHGLLPVPAPATLDLLTGLEVRSGPADSGELTTPTGAVLLKILSNGPPPARYVPRRVGYGAGTRDTPGSPNVLRAILADGAALGATAEQLVLLSADIDDMTPEHVGHALDAIRDLGALDVVAHPVQMKSGRPGWRVEALTDTPGQKTVEEGMFQELSTIGIKRIAIDRVALHRETSSLTIKGHEIRIKEVTLPTGVKRAKPEFADVQRLARLLGVPFSRANEMVADAIAIARRDRRALE